MKSEHIEREFPIEELSRLTFLYELQTVNPLKFKLLKNQLLESNKNFKEEIKTPCDFERDFMKMFKMQVLIQQEDFDKLHMKYQIRFLCFFFCNFVDKILVMNFFQNFWPEIKIYQDFKTVQTK